MHIFDDQISVDLITSLLQDVKFQALLKEFVKIRTTKSASSASVPTHSILKKSLDKHSSIIPVMYDKYCEIEETEERTKSEPSSYDSNRYRRYLYTFDLPDDLKEALRVSNFIWVHYIIQTI